MFCVETFIVILLIYFIFDNFAAVLLRSNDLECCRCAEGGVRYVDSKVDRILEVDEDLSTVLCTNGKNIKSRYYL